MEKHTPISPKDLINAAEQWERVADADERQAAFDREHDYDLSAPGMSSGDRRAEISRCCARTLRKQAQTGLVHCMCHEQPISRCPNAQRGGKVLPEQEQFPEEWSAKEIDKFREVCEDEDPPQKQ